VAGDVDTYIYVQLVDVNYFSVNFF